MRKFHFFESLHPDAMYFLGATATDGNVYEDRPKLDQVNEPWLLAIQSRLWPEATVRKTAEQVWVLEKKDGEIIESSSNRNYLESIQATLAPGCRVRRERQALYTLQRRETKLVAWLSQFGVVPNKSHILKFPKNIPVEHIRDFVRGVIDGDGSIWIHNYRQVKGKETVYEYQYPGIAVYSASKPFLEELKIAIESQIEGELTISILEKESGGTNLVPETGIVHVLRIGSWSAYKVLRWLYYSPDLLCLERKRLVAEQIFAIYADPSKRDVDSVRQEIAEARELRLLRMSYGFIAQAMEISRGRVKNHCKGLPQVDVTQFLPGRRTDPQLIAVCRELRERGWSLYLISDEIGIHHATIYDNVKDIDVETIVTRSGDVAERQNGIDLIIDLAYKGWSLSMIVKETGFSKDKVKYWLKRVPERVRSEGSRKEVTSDIVTQIEQLYEQKVPRKEIAAAVHRSEATVKKYIRHYRKRKAKS